MPEFATEEWAAAAGALYDRLPTAAGADGTVNLAVQIKARREVAFHWRYRGGSVVDGGPGSAGDADLTLTIGVGEAPDLFSGAVEPGVAFMRGRLKTSGREDLLLAFLASTRDPGFESWRAGVAALAG